MLLSNRFVKGLTPPYLIELINIGIRSLKKNELFEGDEYLFKKLTKETTVYGEYGCGKSSKWMLKNSSSLIISVDSSKEWVEKVRRWPPKPTKDLMKFIDLK